MTPILPPYPAYKETGIPWLGRIPVHWKVMKLKRVATINPSKSEARSLLATNDVAVFLPMEKVGGNGTIDISDKRPIAELWSGFTYFRRGDVIVAKITPCFENGKGACLTQIPTEIGFGSTEFHVLRHNQHTTPEFLYRITTLPTFRQLGVDEMTGAAGQQRVPSSFVSQFRAAIPPLPEQRAIARYLDWVDARIRRLIHARQKQIQLLEEYKQALIHQAVTGQIDVRTGKPYPEYKDSGVEWLGQVPAHWEVRRNGQLFAQRNELGFADLPILEVSLRTGVRIRDFENSDRKQVMSDRDKYKRAGAGDIAYNMMRMWQGAVGVAPVDGLISPAYVVAKPLPGTESRYFVRLFRTASYMTEVDKFSRGIVKDRNRLYWEDFKRMPSCYPPPHEQMMIADAIDDACSEINTTAHHVRRSIDLLHEYRTRLIADVVTGKVDVREAAAHLPTEVEEAPPEDNFDLDEVADEALAEEEVLEEEE